jgi:hypothetical protein
MLVIAYTNILCRKAGPREDDSEEEEEGPATKQAFTGAGAF